jgi:hypothetical protein
MSSGLAHRLPLPQAPGHRGLELNGVWYLAFADGDKGCDKGFPIHPELHIHISEESVSKT